MGGDWIDADGGSAIEVNDPATGEIIGRVPKLGAAETRAAIEAARVAQKAWAARTAQGARRVLRKWFDLMVASKDDLGRILTAEQGKPLAEAHGRDRLRRELRRMVRRGGPSAIYGDTIPGHQPDKRIVVLKQPIGVVAAITPWNFPNAMITRKAGPALAAGCAMVAEAGRRRRRSRRSRWPCSPSAPECRRGCSASHRPGARDRRRDHGEPDGAQAHLHRLDRGRADAARAERADGEEDVDSSSAATRRSSSSTTPISTRRSRAR